MSFLAYPPGLWLKTAINALPTTKRLLGIIDPILTSVWGKSTIIINWKRITLTMIEHKCNCMYVKVTAFSSQCTQTTFSFYYHLFKSQVGWWLRTKVEVVYHQCCDTLAAMRFFMVDTAFPSSHFPHSYLNQSEWNFSEQCDIVL